MESYNLLNEQWITVLTDNKGMTKDVSLLDLFSNAHSYKSLAGETTAQDFAILRLLLAIMYTVFTRFDAKSEAYQELELDEKFIPRYDVDEDDAEEYLDSLYETWKDLWKVDTLPSIIGQYLELWKDHFDLFHDSTPFYQVTEENFASKGIVKKGQVKYKLINRLVSESDNKRSLFSPISEDYKNQLDIAAFARWLISFQAYTGTADKAKLPNEKASASKGWLLGLGSIYLKGSNLKQTLLLNLILSSDGMNSDVLRAQFMKKQSPAWEKNFHENYCEMVNRPPSNLAQLFTNYSRFILSKKDFGSEYIEVTQIPKINDSDYLLETMTMWKKDKKGVISPRLHKAEESFWRCFGQISLNDDMNIRPGIITWQNKLVTDKAIEVGGTTIIAVGLDYNRDASTMIKNLIYDELNINNQVLADVSVKEGQSLAWVERIAGVVEETKAGIRYTIKSFAYDIKIIRNLNDSHSFPEDIVRDVYFAINSPFREWLAGIKIDDDKDEKMKAWKAVLKSIIMQRADAMMDNACKRDYRGKTIEGQFLNIAVAHNKFLQKMKKAFG